MATIVERDSEETGTGAIKGTDDIKVVDLSPGLSADALVILDVSIGAVTFEGFADITKPTSASLGIRLATG